VWVMEIIDYSQLIRDGVEVQSAFGNATLRCHNIGDMVARSGQIVACDPFVDPQTAAFSVCLSPGRYPVVLSVAHFDDRDQRVAYAALKISDSKPCHWEMAHLPDQDITALEENHIFCYGVDSGTGCFMDVEAAHALNTKMDADDNYFETLIGEMEKTYVHTWSWANVEMDPVTKANVMMFSSGLGDGCYASYFAFDQGHHPVLLVTDFGVFDDAEVAETLRRNQQAPGANSP
jgi:Protein of unknown function (DUF4241)